ncbi:MAG TPA: LysM peptidoglycan-binding domain-containing protein [Ramlibacter sp.]|nr:LysM peptidoglycan-binding domain-containing protein [Ramlibacter sp.]
MLQHSNNEKTPRAARARAALPAWILLAALASPALAQTLPITAAQRATAQQVAQSGVPLSEVAPNAPDQYTVKRGDTLWAISGMYLNKPWRWPELWGMNLQQVRNPHLIYPGQQLVLERRDGRATLRVGRNGEPGTGSIETVRVSPQIRYQPLPDDSIPTIRTESIEAFLAESSIVDAAALARAPRIVAAPENHVMITKGDRAYVRGPAKAPLELAPGADEFRVVRDARPLKDPVTGAVLGYEAKYLGKATLVRGEGAQSVKTAAGGREQMAVPATIDIVSATEEMGIGDRLLPEPPRQFLNYVPHAPSTAVDATIVSVYGDAVAFAGQNQIVIINKGTADGIAAGEVLAIMKSGEQRIDRSQDGEHASIKLPDERNGLLMVFRPFEKLSYGLILRIGDTVQVGDRVVNPQ